MDTLPQNSALDLELEKGWLTIWFNQPEIRNALTNERVDALVTLCAALKDRRDIRGVTIRGRDGQFCAGGDLKGFKAAMTGEISRDGVIEMSKNAAKVFEAVNELPQITVMAIEGAAMAGGLGLACTGDIIIADTKAKFALTETRIGISPAQIAPFVLQRTGARVGRKLMLLGGLFAGQEALDAGLVDELVNGADEMNAAIDRIRSQVCKNAPGAVAVTKYLIQNLPGLDRDAQVQMAAEGFADCFLSEEGKEGISSFVEKRSPKWAEDQGQ